MKVALIAPMWKTENPYPPLGLAYIAAVLEKDGHNVKIFDLTLEADMPLEDKIDNIVDFSPEIIGMSAMSHNYSDAVSIALYIKKMIDVSIVFGGPHPTIMPEDVLKKEFIDFVVMGEGEDTFLRLCQEIENGKNFKSIEGLCYKDNDNVIIQPRNSYINNLNNIPFPARHLLDLDKYKLIDDFGNKMATIISSRGCPYRCTYCYKGLFGKSYRQRSPENIIDEIKYCIKNFSYKSFYFIDDLFTMNTERVEKLTKSMTDESLNIKWQCLARVNNATLQMFEMMKRAGCYKVHFGIESGNQNILNKVKKGITLEQVKNAVNCCKKSDIKTKGYFMLGLPSDTIETMQDTLNFADNLKLDEMMFSITTPFPGTELWKNVDKNKIGSLSDAFYYSCDNDDIKIFYNLSEVSNEGILNMVRKSQKIIDTANTRRFCERKFGKMIGPLAWQLCKVPYLRKTGKILLRS